MKIIKQDKTVEDFDIGKITRVVKAAGLLDDQAEKLTKDIEKWIEANFTSEIESEKLRQKVVEEMNALNKSAADMFQWYEENKYKTSPTR